MKYLLMIFLLWVSVVTAATVEIGQPWADSTTDGWLDLSDGDSVVFTEDIYRAKWGIGVKNRNVKMNLNGHTLYYDTIHCPVIANADFETIDSTNETKAKSWDFTNAPNMIRQDGSWVTPSTLWRGTYSVGATLPIADQTIKTDSAYLFRSGIWYSVNGMAYNMTGYSNKARLSIGLVSEAGDTLIMRTYYETVFTWRGFLVINAEYQTPDSGDIRAYVVLRVSDALLNSSGGVATGYVYFDDVEITTDRYHGIMAGCDTTMWHPGSMVYTYAYPTSPSAYRSFRWYGHHNSDASNLRLANGSIIDSCGHSFWQRNVLVSSKADSTVVSNIRMLNNGDCSWNYESYQPRSDSLYGCRMVLTGQRVMRRDRIAHGNVAMYGYNGYANNSAVVACTLYESVQHGIVTKTLCDLTNDGINQYPNNRIYDNVIYLNQRYTNGFAITDDGEAPSFIYNNYVNTDSSGCNGSGVHIEKRHGCYNGDARFHNNTVIVKKGYLDTQGYPAGYIPAYGLQLEGAFDSLIMYDNTITAISDCDSCPSASALRINYEANRDMYIHHNTLRGYSIGSEDASPVLFGSITDPLWAYVHDIDNWSIDSNTLITNNCWLGRIAGSRGFQWKNTHFKIDTIGYGLSSHFRTINGVNSNYWAIVPTDSMKFIDNTYEDAWSESLFVNGDVRAYVGGYSEPTNSLADRSADWFVCWTDTIHVIDSTGNLHGALVRAISAQGDTIFYGETGLTGLCVVTIYEFRDSAQQNTYLQSRDRTYFNPYTIRVKYNSTVDTTLTLDSSFTIVVNMGGGVVNHYPTVPTLYSPSDSAAEQTTTPTLVVNNSTDEDSDPLTYSFQVSTNPEFTDTVADTSGVAQGSPRTSWVVDPALSDTTIYYYWRSRAYDGTDYSGWSTPYAWAFTPSYGVSLIVVPTLFYESDTVKTGTKNVSFAVTTSDGSVKTFSAIHSAFWISTLSIGDNTTPGSFYITVVYNGRTPGTYNGTVTVTCDGTINSPLIIPTTLIVTGTSGTCLMLKK